MTPSRATSAASRTTPGASPSSGITRAERADAVDDDRAHACVPGRARVASPLQNLRNVAAIRRTVMALTSAFASTSQRSAATTCGIGAEQMRRAEQILRLHPTGKARRARRREGAIDDVDVEVDVDALDPARDQLRHRRSR